MASEHDAVDEDREVDEQFRTLLEGIRTTLPGISVLLGFLLILPFQGDDFLDSSPAWLYLLAFLSAAMAVVLLVAPSVHQRVRAPASGIPRDDDAHVAAAVHVSLAGTMALAVAITASVALVVLEVQGGVLAAATVFVVAATVAYTWLWQPLVSFRADD